MLKSWPGKLIFCTFGKRMTGVFSFFLLTRKIGLLALSMFDLRAPKSLVDALHIPSSAVRVSTPRWWALVEHRSNIILGRYIGIIF